MKGPERTYRMELQYDGAGLHGWAKQERLATVEGSLEAAFKIALGHSPSLRVAGRTDAGVHARRQVVSLLLPQGVDRRGLLRSLNALTPAGIRVSRLTPAPAGFDARKDAVSRTYRYFVCPESVASPFWAPYSWQVRGPLDLNAMREAAGLVEGRHDFAAFTPTKTEHVFFHKTVIRCGWTRGRTGPLQAGTWTMEIEADAFLRHMVRILVGAMVEIGQGVRSIEDLERALSGASREDMGLTAPAHGLFLWDIRYPARGRRSAG